MNHKSILKILLSFILIINVSCLKEIPTQDSISDITSDISIPGKTPTAVPTSAVSSTPTRMPEIPPNKDREVGIWYSTWYAKLDPSFPGYNISDRFPQHDTWKAWEIPFLPLGPDGEFDTHDSMDTDVINFHLDEMTKAGIDFIIMDQTNHIDVGSGYINLRSIRVARAIKEWNDNPDNIPIRYSSAIGEFQFTKDPVSIEKEAMMLYNRYLNTEFGGPKYHYYLDGKPLLVVYAGNTDISLWENYEGRKDFSDLFTIRWANNASEPGFYGWAYDKGTQYHEEAMVVMPGWRNAFGGIVYRDRGRWYRNSWAQVLEAPVKPRIVIINSFNEYAERTAVWITETSHMTDIAKNREDRWIDESGENNPSMYWDMTIDFIRQYKEG